jgi:hypothetical protein
MVERTNADTFAIRIAESDLCRLANSLRALKASRFGLDALSAEEAL